MLYHPDTRNAADPSDPRGWNVEPKTQGLPWLWAPSHRHHSSGVLTGVPLLTGSARTDTILTLDLSIDPGTHQRFEQLHLPCLFPESVVCFTFLLRRCAIARSSNGGEIPEPGRQSPCGCATTPATERQGLILGTLFAILRVTRCVRVFGVDRVL